VTRERPAEPKNVGHGPGTEDPDPDEEAPVRSPRTADRVAWGLLAVAPFALAWLAWLLLTRG